VLVALATGACGRTAIVGPGECARDWQREVSGMGTVAGALVTASSDVVVYGTFHDRLTIAGAKLTSDGSRLPFLARLDCAGVVRFAVALDAPDVFPLDVRAVGPGGEAVAFLGVPGGPFFSVDRPLAVKRIEVSVRGLASAPVSFAADTLARLAPDGGVVTARWMDDLDLVVSRLGPGGAPLWSRTAVTRVFPGAPFHHALRVGEGGDVFVAALHGGPVRVGEIAVNAAPERDAYLLVHLRAEDGRAAVMRSLRARFGGRTAVGGLALDGLGRLVVATSLPDDPLYETAERKPQWGLGAWEAGGVLAWKLELGSPPGEAPPRLWDLNAGVDGSAVVLGDLTRSLDAGSLHLRNDGFGPASFVVRTGSDGRFSWGRVLRAEVPIAGAAGPGGGVALISGKGQSERDLDPIHDRIGVNPTDDFQLTLSWLAGRE
jgi:hypothetical protein